MQRMRIYKSLPVFILFLCLLLGKAYSEEANQPANQNQPENLSAETIKQVVKEAIREDNREKERNRAQLISTLRSKLNLAVHEWIFHAEQSKETELNKFTHQLWELPEKVTYPVPYDYNLRGYEYEITNQDLKTDPLITSYKANVSISEKQFIEAYHHSDASDLSQYFYTVTRRILLNLEYQQDKFVITDSRYSPVNIEPGWPPESR